MVYFINSKWVTQTANEKLPNTLCWMTRVLVGLSSLNILNGFWSPLNAIVQLNFNLNYDILIEIRTKSMNRIEFNFNNLKSFHCNLIFLNSKFSTIDCVLLHAFNSLITSIDSHHSHLLTKALIFPPNNFQIELLFHISFKHILFTPALSLARTVPIKDLQSTKRWTDLQAT